MADGSDRDEKPELQTGVVKAFVAGVVLANLSKNLLLGTIVGSLAGAYIQQNFVGLPDIKKTWKDFIRRWELSGRNR